ncbi:GNAT family N-acetyltransferase [Microlunatus parietis]|uniref:GNAT superfamily N-acetyltransferase n=1 Tax=Microlunatus parietis TaxID=682979 RepID=A0A7Y9I949_9ACTN|nr:GNAT family N-acetyltransferase [Microlunatus parietis]NYE72530.1 GNAT superfamily N-acetyltransferase [Microlunatus parietis]
MRWTNLAESDAVAEAAFAIPYGKGPGGFMAGHLIAKLVSRPRLARRWPELSVALVDDDGSCVARGVTIPYASTVPGRDPYPEAGWEQAVVWATEDALDGREPDTLCALEIAVHPDHQRRGLSIRALQAMRQNAVDAGFARFIAPVRPPRKADEPWTPMVEYARRTRDDGLPEDPWLRVHVREGGRIRAIAPCSATVSAGLDRWRTWTGLPLDADGPVAIPGGLAPLAVSVSLGIGCYVEPNVWIDHSVPAQDDHPEGNGDDRTA